MERHRVLASWIAALVVLVLAGQVQAGAIPPGAEGYLEEDIEECTVCHDEESRYPVLSIKKTRHAVTADGRTPFGSGYPCQRCHGPSALHAENADDEGQPSPGVRFGDDQPVEPQNAACLSCHKSGKRLNWSGSPHEGGGVACASCHTIHAGEDPVLSDDLRPSVIARKSQTEVCFRCHWEQRAQIHRMSSHPIKEGKVSCTSCHNPHGSPANHQLARATINETCYTCHAEKRGPFLWEHSPAREECTICHNPHGSNNVALLKTRAPQLCQECHLAQFHPSTAYTGTRVVALASQLVAKNCLNCHSEVHGSNHPSGVRWTR